MSAGILAGLLAGALWGLVFVVPRMIGGYTAVDLTAGRFVAFGALSALVMLSRPRVRAPSGAQMLMAALMSLLGFTGYYLLVVLAIRWAGTEVPALIICTIPIWVMLMGKPEQMRWRAIVPGLLLTSLGLALMMSAVQINPLVGPHQHFWWGVMLALAAMACWTVFALLNASWLKRHPEVSVTDWANWMGVATGLGALLLWAVAGSDTPQLVSNDPRWQMLVVCLATGAGSAWGATIL